MSKTVIHIGSVTINNYPIVEEEMEVEEIKGREAGVVDNDSEIEGGNRQEAVADFVDGLFTGLRKAKTMGICSHELKLRQISVVLEIIKNDADARSIISAIVTDNLDEIYDKLAKGLAKREGGLQSPEAIDIVASWKAEEAAAAKQG